MKHRILIVEDEKNTREALYRILRQAGYGVDVAIDGAEALKAVQAEKFNLVVTDINMPNKAGMELIEELGQFDRELQVVVITAYGEEKLRRRARRLGVYGFIDKPFHKQDILDLVGAAFGENIDKSAAS